MGPDRYYTMDSAPKFNFPLTIPHRDVGAFRVAGYNLHGETRGWGPDRFSPYDPTGYLEKLDADIYVLPETWVPNSDEYPGSYVTQWAEDTGRAHHMARSSACTPRHQSKHYGDACVSIVTHFPVLEVRNHLLPRHHKDTSDERNVVAALLDTGTNGKVWVLAVHMSANVPHAPIHNLINLAHFLNDLEKTGNPVIIAGDFNLWGWWVRTIHRRSYRRAVRGRTWPTVKPHSQIDHILVPKNVAVVSSAVLPGGFSDHLPVYADLTTNNTNTR